MKELTLKLHKIKKNNHLIISSSLKAEDMNEIILWIKIDLIFEKLVNYERLDFFLIPALFIAMKKKKTLVIDGNVDALLFSQITDLQFILSKINQNLKIVDVVASKFQYQNKYISQGVGTGFSLGVDCLYF